MEHSRAGWMVQLVGLEVAVFGALPGTHHCCIGFGLFVEVEIVLNDTEMLVCELQL